MPEPQFVPLGSLLTGIDAGHSPDVEDTPAGSGEWGVLKVSAVGADGFHPHENKVVREQRLHNPALRVRAGDLLITRANTAQLVGLACIAEDTSAELMLSDKTLRLRVDKRVAPVRYIQAALGSLIVRRQIENLATGTSGSMKNISQRSIRNLMIPFSGTEDAEQIAAILDSADDQIRRTKQIVVKLRVQKSGLLQQLIGEESTQNSPCRVGDALLGIDAGWSPLCDEEPPSVDRWGVLKVSAVTSGRYIPGESKTLLAGLAPRPDIEVKNGDVIMCRANGAKELVGAVAMIRDTPPKLMLSDKTLRLIANTVVVSPAYLYHFMKSWSARKQVGELLSGSSGQNNISQKFIRSMRMPIPDLPRQQQIVEALSVAENRIEAEGSSLEGLRRLKQGLMDDLLMGRIRVPALYLGVEFFRSSDGVAAGAYSFRVDRRVPP